MKYKSIDTLIREANEEPKEDKYTRLQDDIIKAVALFDTFGYRCQYRSYTNYEEAIYLSRICRKIAKKHNGDTHYAYELFLKYHAYSVYEKNIIKNEDSKRNEKYNKLDFFRWFNCVGMYA